MLLRTEIIPVLARAVVQRLRSDGDLRVDERDAVLIEQRLEDLLRSGLIASTAPATAPEPAMFRKPTVVERRSALRARTQPMPSGVRITEDTLGQFLDAVAAALCIGENALVSRSLETRARAALRAVLPSRVEVEPESPSPGQLSGCPPVTPLEVRLPPAPLRSSEPERRHRPLPRSLMTESTSIDPPPAGLRAFPARPPAC